MEDSGRTPLQKRQSGRKKRWAQQTFLRLFCERLFTAPVGDEIIKTSRVAERYSSAWLNPTKITSDLGRCNTVIHWQSEQWRDLSVLASLVSYSPIFYKVVPNDILSKPCMGVITTIRLDPNAKSDRGSVQASNVFWDQGMGVGQCDTLEGTLWERNSTESNKRGWHTEGRPARTLVLAPSKCWSSLVPSDFIEVKSGQVQWEDYLNHAQTLRANLNVFALSRLLWGEFALVLSTCSVARFPDYKQLNSFKLGPSQTEVWLEAKLMRQEIIFRKAEMWEYH